MSTAVGSSLPPTDGGFESGVYPVALPTGISLRRLASNLWTTDKPFELESTDSFNHFETPNFQPYPVFAEGPWLEWLDPEVGFNNPEFEKYDEA